VEFGFGLLLGIVMMLTNEYLYKRNLVLTAKSQQSEKILGKWYKITPEDDR
jgi:hypothetical protein